eukprot:m.22440 g.22440  ORF g.22440 m.22440 type:complete len:329 (-) comp11252_c0_seq2:11-997(-)
MQATKKLSRAYTTNIIRLICAEVVASDCYAQESIMQGWQLVTKRMNVWAAANEHASWSHTRLKAKFDDVMTVLDITLKQQKDGSSDQWPDIVDRSRLTLKSEQDQMQLTSCFKLIRDAAAQSPLREALDVAYAAWKGYKTSKVKASSKLSAKANLLADKTMTSSEAAPPSNSSVNEPVPEARVYGRVLESEQSDDDADEEEDDLAGRPSLVELDAINRVRMNLGCKTRCSKGKRKYDGVSSAVSSKAAHLTMEEVMLRATKNSLEETRLKLAMEERRMTAEQERRQVEQERWQVEQERYRDQSKRMDGLMQIVLSLLQRQTGGTVLQD